MTAALAISSAVEQAAGDLHDELIPAVSIGQTCDARLPLAPDCPGNAEMIAYVCKAMGLEAEKLEIFRSRVESPVLCSLLPVTFPLPEKWNR